MQKSLLHVGLDVDDNSFTGSALCKETGEFFSFKCKPNISQLVERLKKFQSVYDIKICYEAGYLGFSLYRDLIKRGFNCSIIAPSLIPVMPGDAVKTDRLDSERLAQYFAHDQLTIVHVHSEQEEAARDILRSRDLIALQLVNTKKHIISYCRRMGLDYKTETSQKCTWTITHRKWLAQKASEIESPIHRFTFSRLLTHIKSLEMELDFFETEIEKLVETEPFKNPTEALKAFRGIDTTTAIKIVTELGDIKRFAHPNQLVSYVGLDVREYSSGGKEKKLGITKLGNKRVRSALVEACQFVWKPPQISKKLKERQKQTDPRYIEIANRCMVRLNRRAHHLTYKGKHRNKVVVACAREMLGFIWETLNLESKCRSAAMRESLHS